MIKTMPRTLMPRTLPRFLWHFCKRYPFSLCGLIVVALYWAITISLSPYALKLLIDGMNVEGTNHSSSSLWLPASVYVFITFSTGIVLRLYDWIMLRMFPEIKREITSEMFDYLAKHSYGYFANNFAGSLVNKINDISKGAITVIYFLIDQFLTRFLSLIIGAFAMYLVHPSFAAILITWSVLFITASISLSKKSREYSECFSHSRSVVVGNMVDSITNILNVKLFAREEYENHYLQNSLNDFVKNDRRLQWYLLKVKGFYALSITILTGCMMWVLLYERSKGNITIGDAALILTLTTVLIRDLFLIANQLVVFSEELGTCKQALSLITTPHELMSLPKSPALHVTRGEIVFDDVHFEYRKGQNLFVNKSITLRAGEKVGLVGLSGSGKSTFVNLILRIFDVNSGQILIDGQNIKNVTQESLRSQIAMIPQDPLLFHRTLMDNIRYGRVSATDEEVLESSKRAHCHQFIMALKDGYNSLVGERGIRLSGGQRQRIAIARAILKNGPILIFDEATSSLDSETEQYIQESLRTLMKNKTAIVIAHRLSTLFHMDRLLVFSNGKIIEDGTHAQLIQLNGHYKNLLDKQIDGFIKDYQMNDKQKGYVCQEIFH